MLLITIASNVVQKANAMRDTISRRLVWGPRATWFCCPFSIRRPPHHQPPLSPPRGRRPSSVLGATGWEGRRWVGIHAEDSSEHTAGTGELSREPMEKKFINKESRRLREKHDNLQSSERPCQEKKRLFCVTVRGTMRGEKGRALQEASHRHHSSVLPTALAGEGYHTHLPGRQTEA